MRIGLMLTACKRPYYLEPVLHSWAGAEGANELCGMAVALGQSPQEPEQLALIRSMAPGAHVWPDSPQAAASNGMHRAIAEATSRAFREFNADFMILSEEDLQVSSDVLAYFRWAAETFQHDERVLAVCSHSPGGQGWDPHEPAQDADADQETVRVVPYFNAWCWGTWRDRWTQVLEPKWDRECDSGGALDSGWDWHIATRILPAGNFLCAVPDASRSQNIGKDDGWSSTPQSWAFSQAQSFRETRDSPSYRAEGYEPPRLRPLPSDPPETEPALWAGWHGKLAWDIGANHGQSLYHLTPVFSETWAFEPAEESLRVLQDDWGEHPKVRLIAAAVSDRDGTLTTSVRERSIGQGELVLDADMPEQDMNLPATVALPWGKELGKREVACLTCDILAAENDVTPDFIKVDTEGHEAQVLRGAAKILAVGKTGWLIEFHGEPQYAECTALLEQAGYKPETIRHPHYVPGSPMWRSHGWIRAEAPNR